MSALSSNELQEYQDLPALRLIDPESLDILKRSSETEVLTLQHFPRVHSLEPLSSLKNLRALFLTTAIGWDGTNRHLLVDSFEPLAALQKLEVIHILGVVPQQGRLQPLRRMAGLRRISIGNTSFYQLEDFAALSAALPLARASLQPIYQMNFVSMCRHCQKHPLLYLAGAKPRSPRYACPACGKKKIVAHLQRWNKAGGLPSYDSPENFNPGELMEKFGNPNVK